MLKNLFIPLAHATLTVSTFGFGDRTVTEIIVNIVDLLQRTIMVVCGAAFVVGALFFVIAIGNEEYRSKGKNLMTGSLIGLAIVVAARGIMNMTFLFIYG